MPKLKDTDYLSITARIRAMENRLLTRERMERILDAKENQEAAKLLTECGYGELEEMTPAALERVLAQAQAHTYADLGSMVPQQSLLDVFRIKYDYHNAKVLLKARATGADPGHLLVSSGRWPAKALAEGFAKEDLRGCTDVFRAAMDHAREVLAASGDPQMADFILDRACFEELTRAARESESGFVQGYVALTIDVSNLRAVVRAGRMGKGADFLRQVLVPGGTVDAKELAALREGELAARFRSGRLAQAAEVGAGLMNGGGQLTEFERLCDNAVVAYLAESRRVAFGEAPVLGYLYAREAELTAVRILMMGRMAGLDGDIIRERLRDCYV